MPCNILIKKKIMTKNGLTSYKKSIDSIINFNLIMTH